MDLVTDELDPPDLLSSVPVDANTTTENTHSAGDQLPSVDIKDADLLYKINNLHCPFIWKPEDSLSSFNRDMVEEILNVDEVFDEASVFRLRKFVIHLILCYTNFGKRLLEKSLKSLNDMEKMLLNSIKTRSQDVYFTQINDALFHIVNSCRVVMLHTTNQKEKALEILKKITPYDNLSATNQAGVWAVRANLYVEFGYDGVKAAIQYIEKAVDIDGHNPYWHFTQGMYLGRLRRLESNLAIPSMQEIASLELAMKLKEDASFMAFAAEVYVETANRSTKKSRELLLFADKKEKQLLAEKNDLINERAAMLLKKSVQMNNTSAHLLFRCGKGMLKLAPPYQDIKLARKYLTDGLEISYESSFGNHAMAMYYFKHEQNYNMAKKYLIKATESKNFGADVDLIRVNFLLNRDPSELLDSLMKLFDRYNDQIKHRKILAEVISYYLFIAYNLTEAIKYMNKLLYLIGDHDDVISIFKSAVLRQKFPVSLLEILLSDIADRSNKGTLNSEEQEECRKFMHRLSFQTVKIPRLKNENLRKKFVKEIKESFKQVDVSKVNCPPPSTTEKPSHKEYNPVVSRFGKEYATKYYAEEKPPKNEKSVVDEFFEKYEAAALEKAEPGPCETTKSKDTSKLHPVVKELFSKMKESIKNDDLSGSDEEIMNNFAKQIDLRLSLSARSENNFTVITQDGSSTSRRRDDGFDDPDVYRRRSDRSPRKRSRSRDKYRTGKDRRSDSRDSYHSTREPYKKRSPSVESRYSTRSSRRKRSTSREKRTNRSPSVESRYSTRNSRRKRSTSREKRTNRSPSVESHYSTRSSRHKRSPSRESRVSSRRRSKRRSLSRESEYSVKSNRRRSYSRDRRSTSRDGKLSRKSVRSSKEATREKRSISRESNRSKVERSRRSVSRESHVSNRETHRKRSLSRESRRSSKPEYYRERSISRESRVSTKKVHRKRSMSPESRPSSKLEYSQRTRKRSSSRETHRSNKESPQRSTSKKSYSKKPNRRSPSRSPRPERKDRSKKYLSDDTLTESSSSDSDRDDRRRKNDRSRSYSSDETRPIRSRRSSSKETRSKRASSKGSEPGNNP